jgi:cytochrome c oxidase assembly factor CtaG
MKNGNRDKNRSEGFCEAFRASLEGVSDMEIVVILLGVALVVVLVRAQVRRRQQSQGWTIEEILKREG